MIYRHFDVAIDKALLVWAITLAFTVTAGWIDFRTRRIPNWLNVSALILGIGLHTVVAGWHGALFSLEGLGLGLGLLLPFVLMRGLGAGDWKLMGAVGALIGPGGVFVILLMSALVAGAMAIWTMVAARRVKDTMMNLGVLVQGFVVFGWRGNPQMTIDNPGMLKIPFGVAAAFATLICFVISRWVR